MRANPPLRRGNQQASVSAKVARLLRLYSDDLHVRYGGRTVVGYVAYVRALLAWLSKRGLELLEVRPQDLAAYQTELITLKKPDGRPYSVGHQVNRLKAVKSLFRFLYRRLYILSDPAAALEYPRVEQRLPRTILSKEEVLRMIEASDKATARGVRDRAILEVLYGTGIRSAELINLTPYDVDTDERVLRVVQGKGRKDRNVPLTRAAALAIEDYLAKGRAKLLRGRRSPVLFVGGRGARLRSGTLWLIVRNAAKRAGIRKTVGCHTLRHSVATHLLKGRADIRHIQALLGHSSLATTERYTRVEISDLKQVIDRAHPRGR